MTTFEVLRLTLSVFDVAGAWTIAVLLVIAMRQS
jgi:hypothetical protein